MLRELRQEGKAGKMICAACQEGHSVSIPLPSHLSGDYLDGITGWGQEGKARYAAFAGEGSGVVTRGTY